MPRQRGGKPILVASHIRRHSLVNLEAEELFWIWVIFFDICATVPGFKAGINVCLILSKSQGNLNHQHSAGSLVSGFAGTWKYVPDRGPTPKTGKFLLECSFKQKFDALGSKLSQLRIILIVTLHLSFRAAILIKSSCLVEDKKVLEKDLAEKLQLPHFWKYGSPFCSFVYCNMFVEYTALIHPRALTYFRRHLHRSELGLRVIGWKQHWGNM